MFGHFSIVRSSLSGLMSFYKSPFSYRSFNKFQRSYDEVPFSPSLKRKINQSCLFFSGKTLRLCSSNIPFIVRLWFNTWQWYSSLGISSVFIMIEYVMDLLFYVLFIPLIIALPLMTKTCVIIQTSSGLLQLFSIFYSIGFHIVLHVQWQMISSSILSVFYS